MLELYKKPVTAYTMYDEWFAGLLGECGVQSEYLALIFGRASAFLSKPASPIAATRGSRASRLSLSIVSAATGFAVLQGCMPTLYHAVPYSPQSFSSGSTDVIISAPVRP